MGSSGPCWCLLPFRRSFDRAPLLRPLLDGPGSAAFRLRSLHLRHCKAMVSGNGVEYPSVSDHQPPSHLRVELHLFHLLPFEPFRSWKALLFHHHAAHLHSGNWPPPCQDVSLILSQARVIPSSRGPIRVSGDGQGAHLPDAPGFRSRDGSGS